MKRIAKVKHIKESADRISLERPLDIPPNTHLCEVAFEWRNKGWTWR